MIGRPLKPLCLVLDIDRSLLILDTEHATADLLNPQIIALVKKLKLSFDVRVYLCTRRAKSLMAAWYKRIDQLVLLSGKSPSLIRTLTVVKNAEAAFGLKIVAVSTPDDCKPQKDGTFATILNSGASHLYDYETAECPPLTEASSIQPLFKAEQMLSIALDFKQYCHKSAYAQNFTSTYNLLMIDDEMPMLKSALTMVDENPHWPKDIRLQAKLCIASRKEFYGVFIAHPELDRLFPSFWKNVFPALVEVVKQNSNRYRKSYEFSQVNFFGSMIELDKFLNMFAEKEAEEIKVLTSISVSHTEVKAAVVQKAPPKIFFQSQSSLSMSGAHSGVRKAGVIYFGRKL